MDQKLPNPAYVRSTKSSSLRASANTFKVSYFHKRGSAGARSLSPPGRSSQIKDLSCGSRQEANGTESCRSVSVHSLMEELGKLKSKIPKPTGITPTPEVGKRTSSMQIIEQNRLRVVEAEYQTLQGHQSVFFDSLKSLGPQHSKMIGQYKFVPMVLDADDKLVLQKDTPIDSADSVQELKDRCQAAVDSGFVMLFDCVDPIGMAKGELEARNKKEQLMDQLRDVLNRKMESIVDTIVQTPVSQQESLNQHLYQEVARLRRENQRVESRLLHIDKNHTEQMNRLKTNFEGRLKAGGTKFQQSVDELKERLRSSEAQVNKSKRRLEIQNAALAAKDSTITSIVTDMDQLKSLNTGLNQLAKKSDDALTRAQKELEGTTDQIGSVEVQLEKVQERIRELQNEPDQESVVEKNQLITNLASVQHLSQINEVHSGQEGSIAKMLAANDELETKVRELHQKLKSTEIHLDARAQRAEQLHSGIDRVRAELFRYGQLMVTMREQGIHDHNLISTYTEEINVLKKTQTENRERMEQLYLESAGKDTQANPVRCRGSSNQLDSKEEQLGLVFGQLNRLQVKIRGLEKFTHSMAKLNDYLSQLRASQHERNIQIDKEICQLRDTMFAPEQFSSLF